MDILGVPPEDEPRRSQATREVARLLRQLAEQRADGRRGLLIGEINGAAATAHPLARLFIESGFVPGAMGLQARVPPPGSPSS